MDTMLAILLFGIITINGQGIPPPQPPQVAVAAPPAPAPRPPPPAGYNGIGCPNNNVACPAGKYRYDAIVVNGATYGCNCLCPPSVASACPTNTMKFNWDTCSCDPTPPPTTAAPTTSAPTTGAPTPKPTKRPTMSVFPQLAPFPGQLPGGSGGMHVPAPPIAPFPGQIAPGVIPPAPGSWMQPPGPPMGGPGQLPHWNTGPSPPPPPPVNPVPMTTWAPGVTGAPIDELCAGFPFNVLSFKRVGDRIQLEMECVRTTTTTSRPPVTTQTVV